ncbi:MAG: hypothetical protein ACJA2G_000298 [Cognaticolwellia sp.]|jgi:hypothetical protein
MTNALLKFTELALTLNRWLWEKRKREPKLSFFGRLNFN